jgi:hypothetical protein
MVKCTRPNCHQVGTKGCSAYLKEVHCSLECQKADWKDHKILCKLIKLVPDTVLKFQDVSAVVKKVLHETNEQMAKLRINRCIILLEHAAVFAEHQCGKRIEGKADYEIDGDRIDAWSAEIDVLCTIYSALTKYPISKSNALLYLQKPLSVLEP